MESKIIDKTKFEDRILNDDQVSYVQKSIDENKFNVVVGNVVVKLLRIYTEEMNRDKVFMDNVYLYFPSQTKNKLFYNQVMEFQWTPYNPDADGPQEKKRITLRFLCIQDKE